MNAPNPSSQHQLVCAIAETYPDVIRDLAELSHVKVPAGTRAVAMPTSYPMRDGSTVHGDAAVHFRFGKKARYFGEIEVQREYSLSKLATLRAYHGGEVRRTLSAGHVWVLSPSKAETLKFRRAEARHRDKLKFRVSYLSRADLEPLAAPGRSLAARALAAGLTDFRADGLPDGVVGLLDELVKAGQEQLVDLMVKAILEERGHLSGLGDEMSTELAEHIMAVPIFREVIEAREAEAAARNEALIREAEAQAREAKRAEARAREATARAEARAREATARAEARTREAEARIEALARQTAAQARENAAAIASLRETVLVVFNGKGDTPSEEAQKVLESCRSQATLRGWIQRALAGEPSEQVLQGPR